jgi:hypothetical protein
MFEPNSTLWTPLSLADMEKAIVLRHQANDRFGAERSNYVGASEIGGCPRQVAHRKIDPEAGAITDPHAIGRIMMGHPAEAALVGILRSSHLGPVIRETGNNQAEIPLPDAPMRIHPDGTILRLPIPEGLTHALVQDATGALIQIEAASLKGPGVLEIKSYGQGPFGALKKSGLSGTYQDQVQVQMGATGRTWALVVCGCREDVSRVALFVILFDQARFDALKALAREVMAAKAAVLAGADMDAALPAPIKERGYCDNCALAYSCPAYSVADAVEGATFPEDVALEVEVLAEEHLQLAPAEKRLKEVKEALKDIFARFPVDRFATDSVQTARRYTGARESCDTKKLLADHPAAYSDTVTTGRPSMWVAVSAPKGKR